MLKGHCAATRVGQLRHDVHRCMPDSNGAESLRFRGHPLCLRELQANDRARLEALLAQVAVPDLQMRFFAAFRQVPPALLDQLMQIDRTQRVTVAALIGATDASAEIVGVARAHRLAGATAEAALLVRSDIKGHGLGSLLLSTLIARCRERGISRLIADVMRCNSRMLCLARKYGFRCESVHDNTCQIVLELDTQPA
jgi:GNAT superfamily N-acetyltransferase